MELPLWQMLQPLVIVPSVRCYATLWQMQWPQLHKDKLFLFDLWSVKQDLIPSMWQMVYALMKSWPFHLPHYSITPAIRTQSQVALTSATMTIPSATAYNNHQQSKVKHICYSGYSNCHVDITSASIIILVAHICQSIIICQHYNCDYNICQYTCVHIKSQVH